MKNAIVPCLLIIVAVYLIPSIGIYFKIGILAIILPVCIFSIKARYSKRK